MTLFQSTQNNIVQKPVKLHPENSRFSIICSLSLYKFDMLPQAFIISLVGAYHYSFYPSVLSYESCKTRIVNTKSLLSVFHFQ